MQPGGASRPNEPRNRSSPNRDHIMWEHHCACQEVKNLLILLDIWSIGELVEAALAGEAPEPEGRRRGRFQVIEGGLS